MLRKRSKYTRGKMIGGVAVMKSQGEGGTRRLRCPKCRNIAFTKSMGGKTVNECSSCHTVFSHRPM